MAWAPLYTTVAELKTLLGITDSGDDTALGLAAEAAARAIDGYTGRQFGKIDAAAVRYYAPRGFTVTDDGTAVIPTDDYYSATGMAVATATGPVSGYTTTLVDGTDFLKWPLNAAADGRPWTGLEIISPARGVRYSVTALWGWSAVPDAVKQAAQIQALRFFKRKDAAFGVAGSPELGNEIRLLAKLDPDVQTALAHGRYCRAPVVA